MKKTLVTMLVLLVSLCVVFAQGSKDSATPASGEKTIREHFVAGIDTMPATFNPGSNTAPILNDLVWDELIHYNKVTAELEPCLATSWEWVGDDCKVLRLELRNDVKFHNGNAFTAADVEYTLANNPNANIAGNYDHCEIKNDYSLDIVLKTGNADFVSLLTNTLYAGMIDKESCEADPENGSAVGSGPWKLDLANTVPGDTIELIRNDEYWGPVAPSKYLTLRYIKSSSSRLIALQNDEVQAIMSPGATDIGTIQSDPSLRYCSGAGIGPAKLYYIAFNMKNGACKDNIYLRQAIACVLNRDNIIALSGDRNAVASDGIFWGYDTAFKASLDDCAEDLSYNVEKAKALVAKAVELNGGPIPTLHLTGNTSKSINMTMCLEVQQACKEIGLSVEIDETDSAGILAKTNWDNPSFDIIQYNVPLESWASAANRMFLKGSNNRIVFEIPYVVERMKKAAATNNPEERAQLYKEVQVYVHDNAIYVPAYYGSRDGAERANVSGIIWTNDGYPEFAYAYIED